MSFYRKTFDFFGKMNNNKNFYIFKSTSSADASEIINKIEKFEMTPEFFEFYTNKNVKNIFASLENINSVYKDFYNEKSSKGSQSKIDIYISTLSTIFLITNIISKNRLILEKAISETKKYINKFYLDNDIHKNAQKKLNNYFSNLLGIENKKQRKKYNLFLDDKLHNYSVNNEKPYILKESQKTTITDLKLMEHSINNNSSLNHEKTHDITDNTYNIIEDLTTPKFPSKIIEENVVNSQNKDINESKKNNTERESLKTVLFNPNEEYERNLQKKESIRSLYTLASKTKIANQEASVKGSVKGSIIGGSSKFRGLSIEDKYNSNNTINNIINNKYSGKRNSSRFQNVENKGHSTEIKYTETKEVKSKRTFSYSNIKSCQEKEIIKNLLIFINDLFKQEKINIEEKLKLKHLIIVKSKKLEKLYDKYYKKDENELIKELKFLID
jgi:hypothetical protein